MIRPDRAVEYRQFPVARVPKKFSAAAASVTNLWALLVFYNRAEVKDALAYVRLAMHPEDDISPPSVY